MNKNENDDNSDINLQTLSSNEEIKSYSEGLKNPFLKSVSFNVENEKQKFSIASEENKYHTSNLNNIFKESILISKKKNSLRDSLFRRSFNLEINNLKLKDIINDKEIQFGNFINEKLNSLKNNFNLYLNDIQIKIEEKYTNYILFINEYIQKNEKKISKIAKGKSIEEAFIHYADRNIFKQINLIFEILNNLFESIKDNITLLSKFLEDTSLIFEKNPLDKYINNNSKLILDSFILSKIDFQKLNLTNLIDNEILSEICKNYISKKQNNTCSFLEIENQNEEKFKIEYEFLRDNYKNLIKLKLKKINNQSSIYSFLQQNIKNNIEILSINKCNELAFKNIPNCTNMFKFIIKNTKIKKMLIGENINFKHLQQIQFKNCGINDLLLKDFFKLLIKNPTIQENLEILDLSNNLLTSINLKEFIKEKGNLPKLKYFDLSGNHIYNFISENYKILPSLKILDLTNNNLISSILFENILEKNKEQKFLVLLSLNLFITNNQLNCQNYKNYLFNNIQNCEYQITNLVFSLMFNRNNCNTIQDIKLSPSIKLSLKYLNLSYCGLSSNIVIKFLKGNFGLLNLKKLNLSYNFITNEIFTLYIEKNNENNNEIKDEKCIFEKLIKLDLSFNEYITYNTIEDLELFYNFISEIPLIQKIKLQGTKFENDYFNKYTENQNIINELESKLSNKKLKIYFQLKFITNKILNSFKIISFKK